MSVFNLQQKIKYLLKKHKVVILKTNSSDWQEAFVKGLADGRSVVDISDPMLRERAMWNPEEFAHNLPKPAFRLNLRIIAGWMKFRPRMERCSLPPVCSITSRQRM